MKTTYVTIQYREARIPYNWKSAFTARVLFHDHKIILTRNPGEKGGHSIFDADGSYRILSRPATVKISGRTKGWRVHPKSLERLRRSSTGARRKV